MPATVPVFCPVTWMLVEFTVVGLAAAENVIWMSAVVSTQFAPAAGTIAVTENVPGEVPWPRL